MADTGRRFCDDPTQIRVFDVKADGSLGGGGIFHVVTPGKSDGFRLDSDGNIWTSAADGVHCIAPDGRLLGKILVPELVSNVCFGGRAKHVLFITATTSVYSVVLNRIGVQRP
jgi:gluconolactonase